MAWIADTMGSDYLRPNGLLSAQNDILIKGSVRTFFSMFKVSVSPDVNSLASHLYYVSFNIMLMTE